MSTDVGEDHPVPSPLPPDRGFNLTALADFYDFGNLRTRGNLRVFTPQPSFHFVSVMKSYQSIRYQEFFALEEGEGDGMRGKVEG